MGVTIHFEGRLRSAEDLDVVIDIAREFAESKNWLSDPIDDPKATLQRVRDEEDWDYEGPVKGVALQPDLNSEPLRLEFDRDFFIQEYTKTQFAPIECHKDIVLLLKKIEPLFENLIVSDEGEYYETEDEVILRNHLDKCSAMLDEYLADPEKYYGPVRLQSGRIADLMEQ